MNGVIALKLDSRHCIFSISRFIKFPFFYKFIKTQKNSIHDTIGIVKGELMKIDLVYLWVDDDDKFFKGADFD